mmetsp:Transcript_48023/g.71566  ORF Transcript_48023/g.71566 Transcript_48023/m.71566 type:complete len:591 (-) Transcript_48023:176-1948(-)
MIDDGASPSFWYIVMLSLGGVILVNIVVTLFRPPPKPKFERMPPRPMLTISKAELNGILTTNKKPSGHTSTGTSSASSSTDETQERQYGEMQDDLLGNAEELLQRAARVSGNARSLDKSKAGKGKSAYPKVIEVLGNPTSSDEANYMTREDEEVKIAIAVSAFEAAVNRSRDAHRRALAAEKEQQAVRARARLAATQPTSSSSSLPTQFGAPTPTVQPEPARNPTHTYDVAPSARKPTNLSAHPLGKSKPKTIGRARTPKPKSTDGSPLVLETAGKEPMVVAGKTKKPKDLSKARQNALRLSTLSDEALAAMAKSIHDAARPSTRAKSPEDAPATSSRPAPLTKAKSPAPAPVTSSRPSPPAKQNRDAQRPLDPRPSQKKPEKLGNEKVAVGGSARIDSPSKYNQRSRGRQVASRSKSRDYERNTTQTKGQVRASIEEREELQRALTILEQYRIARASARSKTPVRKKKVVKAPKPDTRDQTPPRSNRTRDCSLERRAEEPEQAVPTTVANTQPVASTQPVANTQTVANTQPRIDLTNEQDKSLPKNDVVSTPVRSKAPKAETRPQTPKRNKTPVTVRRKSRSRLQSLMS